MPRIIYEDDSLLAVDKPGGLPTASLKDGERNTLASWLIERYPELAALPKGRLEAGLVNRLDNETSGAVVAARTAKAYEDLRLQFAGTGAKKEYMALVVGSPPERGTVDAPIAHHPRKKDRMAACESPERAREWKGRPAKTAFETLQRYCYRDAEGVDHDYALLSVTITTGVRHQIRVHMAHLGHPIAGDRIYRNPKKRAADPLALERHFLHASKLTISHPETRAEIVFESSLPGDLRTALDSLRER